ncbi:hypothetical protein [Ferruginibacter sp. SUN106]|uniref:hypothetical protein n=1 Tax=Ferruginibacter sp. SUN106 TaxID=2978348 RepID=UPI003D3692DD
MATLHFFSSEKDLPGQIAGNSYGPMSPTQFRVTSVFNGVAISAEPMAFAVTSGHIFLVKQAGTSKINLVLKPDSLPKGLPPVRYFIYRGLKRDDFYKKSKDEIKEAAPNDSELISHILKAKEGKNAAVFNYGQLPDTMLIDNLFFDKNNTFHHVWAGTSLGRFDSLVPGGASTDYGFEIILDEPGYNASIGIAKKDVNIIDIPATTTGEEDVALSSVLAYIDPAAYYGSFCAALEVVIDKKNMTSDLIYPVLKKFTTKNTVYVDLRNEEGNPLDWFASADPTIKITANAASASSTLPINYRNQFSFPLHILLAGFDSPHVKNSQSFFIINLSIAPENNPTPMIALQCGYWSDLFPVIRQDILFSACTVVNGWTTDLQFAVSAVDDQGVKVPVASYLRVQVLRYQTKKALEDPEYIGNPNDTVLIGFGTLFSPNQIHLPEQSEL